MADYQEKRTGERFAVGVHVDCVLASPVLEDFGKIKVKNISTTGVGLILTEPVPPGMLLVVKLVNPAKRFSKTILVRTVHATAEVSGSYLIGGNLDTPSPTRNFVI
jgi:hypothetical protein